MKNEKTKIIDLGLVDYLEAYAVQRKILDGRKKGDASDTLIIAEHPPVFTIGRSGSEGNLLVDKEILDKKKIPLIKVDRGGDITFHGPGQIVLYPIINIKEWSMDVHRYIRYLEDTMIRFLSCYNIKGRRKRNLSGVWVEGKKVGSVGIGVSRWVSYHGISININVDLSYFSMIKSCGIRGIEMTSLAKILKEDIDIDEAKRTLVSAFERDFSKERNAVGKIPVMA